MADAKNAENAENTAAKARETAEQARKDAENDGQTSSEKKAAKAEQTADDKTAEAAEVRRQASNTEDATTAAEAKAASAAFEPDRHIGDHHAQKFSNTPANPALAPGLDPEQEEGKVKLTMETSDTLASGKGPAVCYVHKEMVPDYLRAGWSRAETHTTVG